MEFHKIDTNKKRYLDLLLLADEQENMIDKYLERGTLYLLKEQQPIALSVVTDEGAGVLEIKNIAVSNAFQRMGYGKRMVDFLIQTYKGTYKILQVGTGETATILAFYEKCGFRQSHRVANFFTDNYDHEIFEDGIQLVDMIYLQMNLR